MQMLHINSWNFMFLCLISGQVAARNQKKLRPPSTFQFMSLTHSCPSLSFMYCHLTSALQFSGPQWPWCMFPSPFLCNDYCCRCLQLIAKSRSFMTLFVMSKTWPTIWTIWASPVPPCHFGLQFGICALH